MKIKRFEDIKPNHRIALYMVYYYTCRTLRQLEADIHKTSTPANAKRQLIFTHRIHHKLEQIVAKWKANE